MTYKKISYEIVGRFDNGSKFGVISKKVVEGYQIDNHAAVRKNDWKSCPWTVDSFETGIAIVSIGCATRAAAIEQYENMKGPVVQILEDSDKMKRLQEKKAAAIPEAELATYEEKDITVLHDWRLDKITDAAKKAGCIIKEVADESYQSGGRIKVYGTPEMLQGVNDLLESWEEKEMEKNEKSAVPVQEESNAINIDALTAENIAEYLPALLMSLANDKHNSSIILAAGIEAGAINPLALLDYFQNGRMPAVHTFDAWQKAGFKVRKGEKAAFSARIWKHVEKPVVLTAEDVAAMNAGNMVEGIEYHEGDTISRENFIKKNAYFFTYAQVEKAPALAELPQLPDGVKKETRGGCCWISGDTKPIKEELKAAGFRWSKKSSAWYRREAA